MTKTKGFGEEATSFVHWIQQWPKEYKERLHVFLWDFEMAKRIDEEVACFFHGI
jgi:hypothetical protein